MGARALDVFFRGVRPSTAIYGYPCPGLGISVLELSARHNLVGLHGLSMFGWLIWIGHGRSVAWWLGGFFLRSPSVHVLIPWPSECFVWDTIHVISEHDMWLAMWMLGKGIGRNVYLNRRNILSLRLG